MPTKNQILQLEAPSNIPYAWKLETTCTILKENDQNKIISFVEGSLWDLDNLYEFVCEMGRLPTVEETKIPAWRYYYIRIEKIPL